ncbi:hypothetical protein [Saccharococcus caldoxylosilyticus]|jgi:hypothetical protein|uniref:Uncharacterized protein n=2 Tax=Saccharococcus caldoxylosilyticus TaxID=81408 RepID=A0A023DK69_9BACL|nr:hypothetical protein [Parageobacillus caldoxylosilyticus]KYD06859.1 hypothetical protein B4119_0644 [Parageobacillus caldoxylosilyticus]MBB3854522.1 hypothetical protein [Parageobacillus caldoxylosilyticus]QXJ37909.1 hypothetical protein BV455_01172 [Parageobacillus caldoxylosilyticus]BDG42178.1 hypothetical protein PcaKH35_05230 [Parageobacillus caldoxylosilyticus]GAJ41667.1 hypothetical protein GCA01S_085_00020 [Parageobacillus caldoxylosilyticus NBRC 107762]
MKEVLQRVKEKLEQSFDQPGAYDLDQSLRELEQLKATAGDKQQMIEDVIRAVTHAKNAQAQLVNAGDESATNAFAEAYRALDQAIESYSNVDNDPV